MESHAISTPISMFATDTIECIIYYLKLLSSYNKQHNKSQTKFNKFSCHVCETMKSYSRLFRHWYNDNRVHYMHDHNYHFYHLFTQFGVIISSLCYRFMARLRFVMVDSWRIFVHFCLNTFTEYIFWTVSFSCIQKHLLLYSMLSFKCWARLLNINNAIETKRERDKVRNIGRNVISVHLTKGNSGKICKFSVFFSSSWR